MNTSIDRELILALSAHFYPVGSSERSEGRPKGAKAIRAANRLRSAEHKQVGKATNSNRSTQGGRFDGTERGGFVSTWRTRYTK